MKRLTSRSAVVITMTLSASCAGSTTVTEAPPDPIMTATPTANPPAPPPRASILDLGATLVFRHGACAIIDPPDPHVDPSAHQPTVPPAPMGWRSVPCPTSLTAPGRIERDAAGVCSFTAEECPPPVLATCNPPPPRRVPCDGPAADPSPGPVTRSSDGTCFQHVNVQCPPPYQPACTVTAGPTPVACPE